MYKKAFILHSHWLMQALLYCAKNLTPRINVACQKKCLFLRILQWMWVRWLCGIAGGDCAGYTFPRAQADRSTIVYGWISWATLTSWATTKEENGLENCAQACIVSAWKWHMSFSNLIGPRSCGSARRDGEYRGVNRSFGELFCLCRRQDYVFFSMGPYHL